MKKQIVKTVFCLFLVLSLLSVNASAIVIDESVIITPPTPNADPLVFPVAGVILGSSFVTDQLLNVFLAFFGVATVASLLQIYDTDSYNWVDVSSNYGNSILVNAADMYSYLNTEQRESAGLYYKTRILRDTEKIQIDPRPLNYNEAVDALDSGYNLFTVNAELAEKACEGASPIGDVILHPPHNAGTVAEKFYSHYHPVNFRGNQMSVHCWYP